MQHGNMEATKTAEKQIWEALEEVKDPEIPVLSVVDLGIITKVQVHNQSVDVVLTPTFSGCPALKLMEKQVADAVKALGFLTVNVSTNFDVAWSTNRISEKGRAIIKNFGLAPPPKHDGNPNPEMIKLAACPHCNSTNTSMNSFFGPTLCRSIHYCFDCLQSFEQFKPV